MAAFHAASFQAQAHLMGCMLDELYAVSHALPPSVSEVNTSSNETVANTLGFCEIGRSRKRV